MTTTYRIAEVADRSGFTTATLRYYEDRGLLAPVGRTDAGYRLYDDAAIGRLRFIARAKQLGCTLDEVAELSAAWDGGRCAHVQERLRALVAAKVSDTHRRIAELTTLAADLQRAAAALAAGAADGPCDDTCGCLAEPGAGGGSRVTVAVPGPAGLAGVTGPGGAVAPGAAILGADAPVPVPLVSKPAAADAAEGDSAAGLGAAAGPPIACTLDAGDMAGRLDAWNAVLAATPDLLAGVTSRQAVDGGVRLAFGPGADVTELARLAAAEQACCRFFSFALVVDDRGLALEVRAPADAADVVTAVFGAPDR